MIKLLNKGITIGFFWIIFVVQVNASVISNSGTACITVVSGSTISGVARGYYVADGFEIQYVLTNATDEIISSNTTGSFIAPMQLGEYRIYAVNYSTTGTQPNFAIGGSLLSIGGDCTDVSDTPKCFNVIDGNVTCTEIAAGGEMSARMLGSYVADEFAIRYVLTDAVGSILLHNTTGIFTAPLNPGEYRIYGVNYSTSGQQPSFSGNIMNIGGECVAISAVPKCFIVVAANPGIALVKQAMLNASENTITYVFTIINTGDVDLSNVNLTDPKLGGNISLSTNVLLVGQSISTSVIYNITSADRTIGKVINTASVSGETFNGVVVTDISGSGIDNDDPTEIIVPKCPEGVQCLTVKVTKR